MDEYVTVSFSGGKDSTAMLLHMMELGDHIDEVINTDTGMEFPAMYDHLDRVRRIVEDHGIKYTTLRAEHTFEWYMMDKPVKSEKWGDHNGYGWPSMAIRWCTRHLKADLIDKHLHNLRASHDRVVQCIGLAADEEKRLSRPHNLHADHRHPLVEWGWTEADCLAYCYDHGYDWGGLYEQFGRVSCWCCPLASINEIKTLWRLYPELWARLLEWDARLNDADVGTVVKFKGHYTVADLTARFAREDLAEKEQTSLDDYIPIIPT